VASAADASARSGGASFPPSIPVVEPPFPHPSTIAASKEQDVSTRTDYLAPTMRLHNREKNCGKPQLQGQFDSSGPSVTTGSGDTCLRTRKLSNCALR
jgi:hypothetical protein